MKPIILMFALAALAGCDRKPDERAQTTSPTSQAAAGGSAPSTAQSNTPSTPANLPPPQSEEEKREGANPVQEQVDPKQPEQHRDFRMQGDSAGPRGPDTQPKSGG